MDFDPSHPPAAIGESLAQVLSRWGEAASFGADCGSWLGPSVDTQMRWRDKDLHVMALLRADRVTALRYERRSGGSASFEDCLTLLNSFTTDWKASGIETGNTAEPVYDGPVQRSVRPALLQGMIGGRFEADYRASRGECRVALIVVGDAP
jgi:hypothetical protein